MVPSWARQQWEGTVENKASTVTTTLHFCCFNKETGSGVGTHKIQTELIIVAPVRDAQTDQFTVSSRGCLSTSSSLLCFFYAVSLIALGMEPHSYWPMCDKLLGNNWLKCNICPEINSKQIGNDLQGKQSYDCLSLGSLQFLESHHFKCSTWFESCASKPFRFAGNIAKMLYRTKSPLKMPCLPDWS